MHGNFIAELQVINNLLKDFILTAKLDKSGNKPKPATLLFFYKNEIFKMKVTKNHN